MQVVHNEIYFTRSGELGNSELGVSGILELIERKMHTLAHSEGE